MSYGGLFRSAMVALLRNKLRSLLTVLGICIGIAAVICVVAIGKAGQARVEQYLNKPKQLSTLKKMKSVKRRRVRFTRRNTRVAHVGRFQTDATSRSAD